MVDHTDAGVLHRAGEEIEVTDEIFDYLQASYEAIRLEQAPKVEAVHKLVKLASEWQSGEVS